MQSMFLRIFTQNIILEKQRILGNKTGGTRLLKIYRIFLKFLGRFCNPTKRNSKKSFEKCESKEVDIFWRFPPSTVAQENVKYYA